MASKGAQYITKKHKNKNGEEVSIDYRIDAEFVPTKISEICEEFIQNYVEANNQVDWLITQYEAKEEAVSKRDTKKRKEGEKYLQQKSFVSIRSDFVDKFFPDIREGTGKEETAREKFLKKYKKK